VQCARRKRLPYQRGHASREWPIVEQGAKRPGADLEMTFEDPKYYTRPFTLKTAVNLLPDTDVLELCAPKEKDRAHLGSDMLHRAHSRP
jgi:hypothetical protein